MEEKVSEPILLNKREAATALGISIRTLDHLISARKIRPRRIGRRVLISRQTLEHFANPDKKPQSEAPDDTSRDSDFTEKR
jgi:excisionase family DNA binding protein